MRPTYSSKPSDVQPAKLDDRALLAIGRLIRACAEVEDLINLFICNLAKISESKMIVLMGRTAISRRVEIAEYLAKMNSPGAAKLAEWAFNQNFWDAIQCRNSVAHGVLLGLNDEGLWSFLTAKTEAPEGESAIQIVASYSTPFIEAEAAAVEAAIPLLEGKLKLRALRETRLHRPLSPHRKGLRQPKPAAKPPRPPRSSRASRKGKNK